MRFAPLVEPVAALSSAERLRTARHLALPALAEVGQRRLAASTVAVVGAGGLGSPAILALAAAGVGTLIVIDDDVVETSNLQRQVLHRQTDIGQPKVHSAARSAAGLSPETRIVEVNEHLDAHNAARLLAGADVVLDGSDRFSTREDVAAACEAQGIPLVWGAVQAFDAQVTVFWSTPPDESGLRLRDLYPPGTDAPSCAEAGVLGPLCLQVGAIMATEAIKLITGIGDSLFGRVLVIDSLAVTQREVVLRPSRTASPLPNARRAEPTQLAVHELPLLDGDDAPLVVDVRTLAEVSAGTIPGSVHVELRTIQDDPDAAARRIRSYAAGRSVALLCQIGGRATVAARILAERDLDAAVLSGGFDAWALAQNSSVR